MMFVSHWKHTYRPPRPVKGIALLFYTEKFVPQSKHIFGLPGPVTGIALLFYIYVDDVRTSQQTTYGPPRPVKKITFLLLTFRTD
jgi:hypothetical protein